MQAQLRLDDASEQTYIEDLVDAATAYAEKAMDASLLTRTMTVTVWQRSPISLWTDYRLHAQIFLPRGPVQSITSVVDANAVNITNYTFERIGFTDQIIINQAYVSPVVVTYVAGYGTTAAAIDADIRLAIRTHVASLWRVREHVTDRELLPCPDSLQAFYALNRRTAPVA